MNEKHVCDKELFLGEVRAFIESVKGTKTILEGGKKI